MKITQKILQDLIKEELKRTLKEQPTHQSVRGANPEGFATGDVGKTADPGRFGAGTTAAADSTATTAAGAETHFDKILNRHEEDIALIRQALQNAGISIAARSADYEKSKK